MAPENPVVNAMLLCEHVHRDSMSGKHTLFAVFDEVEVRAFPVEIESFAVYLNLTNMRGRYSVDFRWLLGDTEEELARVGALDPFEVSDPLSRVELVILGGGLPIHGPGRYVLRLDANGRHLQDYVIIAIEAPE